MSFEFNFLHKSYLGCEFETFIQQRTLLPVYHSKTSSLSKLCWCVLKNCTVMLPHFTKVSSIDTGKILERTILEYCMMLIFFCFYFDYLLDSNELLESVQINMVHYFFNFHLTFFSFFNYCRCNYNLVGYITCKIVSKRFFFFLQLLTWV